MYAIVETGGKQVKVEVGQAIYVEKIEVAEGESYTFDKVLLVSGDETKVGAPYVEGATVEGVVVKNGKSKKITIFKYTPNHRSSRRKQGHRQPYTKVEIKKIK